MGRRTVITIATAVMAACAVGAFIAFTTSEEPSGPPQLTSKMVEHMKTAGLVVVPDEAKTSAAHDDARQIATRYQGLDSQARLTGVSLATIVGAGDDRFVGRLMWVVYVEDVRTGCFGPAGSCDGPDPLGTEVELIDPDTLEPQRTSVF
jgi:hypothetical protein